MAPEVRVSFVGLKFQPVGADPVFRQIGSELCQIVEYPVGVRKLLIVGAKPSLLFGIDDWHPCTPPGTPRCLESLTVDQSAMRPPGPSVRSTGGMSILPILVYSVSCNPVCDVIGLPALPVGASSCPHCPQSWLFPGGC